MAAAARRWLSTASASWSSREILYFFATFSAVTPMWTSSNGSLSAPTIMSIIVVSFMRAPQRIAGDDVGTAAHVLGAARHGGVGVAEHDRLGRGDDRLQAAAAQAIQRQRRHLVRQPAFHAGHAREIVIVRVGVDDVAEDHVADVSPARCRPASWLPHAKRGKFTRRSVFQAPAVTTDGGPHATEHHDFTRHDWYLP